MNPYRARLIGVDDYWPGWWSASQNAWNFIDWARLGPRPQPEWLEQVEKTARTLVTGEA